jgi:hypothetical protein
MAGAGVARDGGAPVMGKVIAMQSTGWHVIIEFDEDDRHTHATATARGPGEPTDDRTRRRAPKSERLESAVDR